MIKVKIFILLKSLLLPPIGFLLLGIWGLFVRRKEMGGQMIVISLLGLLLFSLPAFVDLMAKSWESIPVLQPDQILQHKPQAIVVLGGGLKQAGKEFGRAVSLKNGAFLRVRYAAKLARETGLPVLVSGGKVLEKFSLSEAEVMAEYLRNEFELNEVWREDASRNTAENARYSNKLLSRKNIQRIILVTQAYHMPRAVSQFDKQGLTVLPAPTDFISNDERWDVFSFIPSVYALKNSYLIVHEWVGSFWYALRHA